jgi:hypothetical protein
LTLFVVPVMYSILDGLVHRGEQESDASNEAPSE